MLKKVVLITGSTDGIGKETARELACMGLSVIIHGRDIQRGEATQAEIRRWSGNPNVDLLIADLSSQRQVRQLAADIQKRFPRLDILVHNAGVILPIRQLSEDGLEMTLAVNHLAPFLLTHLLLDLLERSAPARIVVVSSNTHRWISQVDFDNLQGEKSYNGSDVYALSKLGNVLFTLELAERLKGRGVTVNALHPGVIHTKLLRTGSSDSGGSLAEGAETPVYLATAREVESTTGGYFERKNPTSPSYLTQDRKLRNAFWEASCRLVGVASFGNRESGQTDESHLA